ncbi:MAG: sigma-70 family RNA polymerase sigma factor [Planctomycetia bacterium]|nr:sigma-70 family RNA polymerase sigma factor [Planctomycetia bacterium]
MAFVTVAERYRSEVYTWARRIVCNHHAAEDVVQETLLAVFRASHTYDPTRPFGVWLRTIAINCARARLKKDQKLSVMVELPEPEVEVDSLGALIQAEEIAFVRAATWNLDPHSREALRLRYLNGLTHDAVAARLGVTTGSASGTICRARKKLRQHLARASGLGGV